MVGFIVSAILIIGGVIMYLFPSKNSNWVYGYRTRLSMKNQDTWKVSQKIGGFSMIVFGIIFLIIHNKYLESIGFVSLTQTYQMKH